MWAGEEQVKKEGKGGKFLNKYGLKIKA